MAPTAKRLSVLFFLSLFPYHLSRARDLQSFSKFTNIPTTTTTTTPTETIQVPNKEQQPSFLPDTQTGYGLYGHESGQLPPATDALYATSKSTTDAPYTTSTPNTNNNPNSYYNKKAYVTDPQGMSDTRILDRGSTTTNSYKEAYVTDPQGYTTSTSENYYNAANSNYYYTGKQGLSETNLIDGSYTTAKAAAATAANNYFYGGTNSNNNNQKQGISDTRFLGNGKYYYKVPRENNYGSYGYENSRGVNSNNKGYYGNNHNSYMGGYENQEQFQENEEEFVP